MKLSLISFTRQGGLLCQTLFYGFLREGHDCEAFCMPKYAEECGLVPLEESLGEWCGSRFSQADALVFVGACGIAVRGIAPHVRDKTTDPAVVSVDELARFVIPLLSGHIGGANALALELAEKLGASAAVTTATDVNGKFSVDAWAAERGLFLSDMKAAKAVSAAILEGPVSLKSDFPVRGTLPPGIVPGKSGPVGICISWRRQTPFKTTLLLVPPVIRLGIGCRRGTPAEAIGALVDETLAAHRVHPAAVKSVGSIDLKQDEAGLLAFCRERGWPVEFYTASQLEAAEGDFTPSDFVRRTVGVDNVCERAAVLGGGRIVIQKTAGHGVTVAAAAERYEVRFDG